MAHRLLLVLVCLFGFPATHAQQLLLDEEFSTACQQLAAPLRKSLAPNTQVRYVLVNSPEINAFVTPENIIYIHSGLILKAKSAAELQGVLAHELGHLAANHLLQRDILQKQAMVTGLAGAVAGAGAIAAGAGGQAGTALILSGQAGGLTQLLAHTRTQEAEADRYAANALHNAGLSVKGMVGMFNTLRTESQLSYETPPPWLVSHPLPPERLASLQSLVEKESPKTQSSSFNFARLQAKVFALTNTPASTLRKYSGTSTTTESDRYARAIALTTQGKLKDAATTLAPLLAAHPADAFYQELAATIATQQSNLPEATRILRAALKSNPSAFLLRYQLAELLRAQNNPAEALPLYQRVVREWPEWNDPWRSISIVYGQLGRLPETHLALAEANIQELDLKAAKQSLALAETYLKSAPAMNIREARQWAETLTARLKTLKD